jgi:mannan endo-1,4-beta-mannosidase
MTILLVTMMVGIGGFAASTSLGAKRSQYASAPHCQRCNSLWGVTLGPPVPRSWVPVRSFEHMIRKNSSLVPFGSPFVSCTHGRCTSVGFPRGFMQTVRAHGAIPFLSWASEQTPGKVKEPSFTLSAIIKGRYDGYIRSFAHAAAVWGHPFFLRFDWEMNGNWFPWSTGVNGNTSAEYVLAWQHVHRIFTLQHASNASWVWCPNIDPDHLWANLRRLYPGDGYVDWTCLDGYNWGTDRGRWQTFDQLYGSTYARIVDTIAPSKPMMIGEVSSNGAGGSLPRWIVRMFAELPSRYAKVHGVIWWNIRDPWGGVPLVGASAGAHAFAQAIGSPRFATNIFCHLANSPITPPAPSTARASHACAPN